jgi:hypothetical protein
MRRQSYQVWVTTMQRPRSSSSSTRAPEFDMSRPGMEPGPPGWDSSTLAKSYSYSLLITIRNIYMRLHRPYPLCMCYMKPHELH